MYQVIGHMDHFSMLSNGGSVRYCIRHMYVIDDDDDKQQQNRDNHKMVPVTC